MRANSQAYINERIGRTHIIYSNTNGRFGINVLRFKSNISGNIFTGKICLNSYAGIAVTIVFSFVTNVRES